MSPMKRANSWRPLRRPPIRPLTVGYGDTAVKVGGETVLFRHEKTFFNPTGLAAMITDDLDVRGNLEAKAARYMTYQYERVGLNLRPELIALKCVSGDGEKFLPAAKAVIEASDMSLILVWPRTWPR